MVHVGAIGIATSVSNRLPKIRIQHTWSTLAFRLGGVPRPCGRSERTDFTTVCNCSFLAALFITVSGGGADVARTCGLNLEHELLAINAKIKLTSIAKTPTPISNIM